MFLKIRLIKSYLIFKISPSFFQIQFSLGTFSTIFSSKLQSLKINFTLSFPINVSQRVTETPEKMLNKL